MHWKNWPYWGKGAIIGFVIGSIILAISRYAGSGAVLFFVTLFAMLPGIVVNDLLSQPSSSGIPDMSNVPYVNIFSYLIIGAAIGYLYGKIKNRKQLPT